MNKKIIQQIRLSILLFVPALLFPLSTILAQNVRVTIRENKVKMEQVISSIERQTRYLFGIDDDVNTDLLVTVNVENEPLKKALDEMIRGTDIAYSVEGTNILLFRNSVQPGRAAKISGQVVDAKGVPIIGASVIVRGTTVGVSTDAGGRFTLEVPAPAASQTLEVSYLGYETATVAVGSRTNFTVTLRESTSEIESVVVTALGIKREEKALSYNVQQVGAEDLTTVKDANFMNSLAGKVAGVTINTSSSGVGGATKVVLRGNKSISQSSNALYVIDGIPMYNFGGGGGTEFDSRGATESIADINPEDIESMSVLTGAAAAALYGSEAANGAVMITTKKGQAGALKVTLSSNTEFLNPFVLPEFQNRYGTGLNGTSSGSKIYSWGERLNPASSYGYTPNDFFETGHVYTNAVTVSGGTDRNQTYFSAASVNSDGIIPNNEYDRYNFTFRNTSYFLKDKLRLDASASYIYQQDQNMTNQGVYSNPLVPAYLFPRGENFDLYRRFERYNEGTKLMEQFWSADMEGGDLRMQNPYWIAYRNLRNTDKKRYMLSFSASYDILPWLNVTGRVRIDNANSLYTQKLYASSNTTITDGGKNGHYTEARAYDSQTYGDVMVNINKTFGDDWSLQANVGASVNNVKSDELSYRGPIQENGLPNVFNVFDLDDTKKRAEDRLARPDAVRVCFGRGRLEADALFDRHGPQRLGLADRRIVGIVVLLSVGRSVVGAYLTLEHGGGFQLSENPRFDRLGGYAVPALSDDPDLRIRRHEPRVEGQDPLSDRGSEARADNHLRSGSRCTAVETCQPFGFVVPGRHEEPDVRPFAAAVVLLYDNLPADGPRPQYGRRTLGRV